MVEASLTPGTCNALASFAALLPMIVLGVGTTANRRPASMSTSVSGN
jgi:hypothetical protein